ncbi:hypothetical protein TIFTF001_028782 [Ficus carica]|uniref:Uncharacterized protein n=1 Tax=Ficus carica TaxID=3494 RepID=A0AA88J0J4_FICCA|nr:hypothetical protein TIFTF001_028782 [Ficus carica]
MNGLLAGLETVSMDQDVVGGQRAGEAPGVSEDDEGPDNAFQGVELSLYPSALSLSLSGYSLCPIYTSSPSLSLVPSILHPKDLDKPPFVSRKNWLLDNRALVCIYNDKLLI